jgi:putative sigma-54 modulation protein
LTERGKKAVSLPEALSSKNETQPKIVKIKRFELKPMDIEEAILQMEMLGHSFFLYKDSETNKISLLYKRKDGNYGLIISEDK